MSDDQQTPFSSGVVDKIPSFPADVPIARVNNISHAALCSGDSTALKALLNAARTTGFFRLDLTDSEQGRRFLASADKMFKLAAETFDLPKEVKLQDKMLNHGHALLG